MRKLVKKGVTALIWLSLLSSALLFLLHPALAPFAILPSLLLSLFPLINTAFQAKGTALRASVIWAILAVLLAILSQIAAINEPFPTGRPLTGHLAYLSVLTTLAALISVLNARTPGGGAWAILMSLLILVFLIPWLESSGIGRPTSITLNRLRLDNPWTIFFGLVVLAGVTNYLPTRYFLAASCLALGLLLEYLALTRLNLSPTTRATLWSAFPLCLAAAVAAADLRSRSMPPSTSPLEAAWLWFRDHWGVVWALRVLERFNRSAESQTWPIRLSWQGVVPFPPGSPSPEIPSAALPLLLTLLRRFASPERVVQAIQDPTPVLASPL